MNPTHPIRHRDGSGPDRRYTVALEYCGHPEPRHVARFCGEFIGQRQSHGAAVLLCIGNRNVREGAVIVTEKTA